MAVNNINRSYQFYGSFLEKINDNKNEIFTTNIESIKKDFNDNHYFCTQCHKFPFIKFCKNKKDVRLTCSCFNNKKISIEELFNLISIKNIYSTDSPDENKIKFKNEVICNEHNKPFKDFSKFF